MTDFFLGASQPVLAGLFFILALRLLLGRRLGWSIPGRRASGSGAPAARLAAAVQPLTATLTGDQKMSNLTAAWIAKGTRVRERSLPSAEPSAPETSPDSLTPAAPPPGSAELGHRVDPSELIRWGQQAARAGDRQVAYRLFIRATESAPASDEAWTWRAATCDQPEEAIRCLERVLEINPGNLQAQRGLSESRRRLADI